MSFLLKVENLLKAKATKLKHSQIVHKCFEQFKEAYIDAGFDENDSASPTVFLHKGVSPNRYLKDFASFAYMNYKIFSFSLQKTWTDENIREELGYINNYLNNIKRIAKEEAYNSFNTDSDEGTFAFIRMMNNFYNENDLEMVSLFSHEVTTYGHYVLYKEHLEKKLCELNPKKEWNSFKKIFIHESDYLKVISILHNNSIIDKFGMRWIYKESAKIKNIRALIDCLVRYRLVKYQTYNELREIINNTFNLKVGLRQLKEQPNEFDIKYFSGILKDFQPKII